MPEQDAQTTPTWKMDGGQEYPLFPFDEPPVVKLPNGTTHYFRMWDEVTEKRREDLLKTVIITSPAIINGENPRQVNTDFTRSALAYYDMMVTHISGVSFNGNKPEDKLDVKESTGETVPGSISEKYPEGKPATILDYIGVPIKRAAALRIYGGKIEVEGLDEEEDEDFDGDPFAELDIQKQVDKAEARREIYQLTLDRTIRIRQELGVEEIKGTGRTTEPTHVIRYHFTEPDPDQFSRWEMKGSQGYSVGLKKGGERRETRYNLDTVASLFDALIDRIEGASIGGAELNVPTDRNDPRRATVLAQVPLPIKKLMIGRLFAEMQNLGNS